MDRWHSIPLGDLREHVAERTCWCCPTRDDEDGEVWIHHSMDGREAYETGERKVS